jgi:signal transduction histidine kinase
MNRAARELRGVDVEGLFELGGDHDLASFLGQLRMAGRASIELQVKSPDGGARHLLLEGRTEDSYRVVVLRDVTERLKLEEELQHLRRVESFGYLTASVAHDFNNLLTIIGCATAVLTSEARAQEGAGAGEQVLALANEIQSATERATTMVRQLLSRMRRKASRPEAVNVGEVVVELRPLLERLVGDGVEVSFLLDPELGSTVVDRSALEHALLNLAADARDAMPEGGRFTVATCNVSLGEDGVAVDAHAANGRYVALTVSDSGVGMSREVRERIFERFFTTKGSAHGSGLGLAMVRRFAVQSGGCVAAHSAPGQGTTIVLYLPRTARVSGQATLTPCPLS